MPLETSLVRRFAILILLTASIAATATVAQSDPTRVEKAMSSGQKSWTSAFDFEVTADDIVVNIRISLLVPGTVNRPLLEDRLITWKAAIDATWNNRFYARVEGERLPLRFDIRFTHFRPHHRVVIQPGNWVANQHKWYVDTPPAVVAHEVGHMLGAFDEYSGGTLSPRQPLIDDSSIMGPTPDSGLAYPRHLALLSEKLAEVFDADRVEIITD